MNEIIKIILYSFFAGITVFLGGLLSRYFERVKNKFLKEKVIHSAVAFGGGVLIAAVAFVLTPKGIELLNIISLSLLFIAGGISFFILDKIIEKHGGSLSQLMAMLMDFIPEAIALGAVFAHDHRLGLLLAIFIGLQNLPESFNSYIDLRKSGYSPNRCLTIFFPLSFVGILAALLGNFLLANSPSLIASLMLFSGGGIVYLMFQDIAPMSKMKDSWSPALGATLGFLIGMIGEKILG